MESKKFMDNNFYVSWHPSSDSSQVHCIYSEMLVYFYLKCLKPVINDINTNIPVQEMLEILEEPPRKET